MTWLLESTMYLTFPRNWTNRLKEGRSVLHWVCALGDLAKVNTVLSIPGVQVNEQDNAGWTPLMIAGMVSLVVKADF